MINRVGISINFYIGQRVVCEHGSGKLVALLLSSDNVILGTIGLDNPIAGELDQDHVAHTYIHDIPVHELQPENSLEQEVLELRRSIAASIEYNNELRNELVEAYGQVCKYRGHLPITDHEGVTWCELCEKRLDI